MKVTSRVRVLWWGDAALRERGARCLDACGLRTYARRTAGLRPRSSFHYREPTTVNSRSSKNRALNAQYTRYRLVEIRLPERAVYSRGVDLLCA